MTGKMKLYIGLLVLGLLVLIHGSSCTSGTSTTSPGKIAFVSIRDGIPQIYVMETDGNNQTRLIRSGKEERYPSWSPDGKKIVFVSDRSSSQGNVIREVYLMNADGENQTRLTDNQALAEWPAWSP